VRRKLVICAVAATIGLAACGQEATDDAGSADVSEVRPAPADDPAASTSTPDAAPGGNAPGAAPDASADDPYETPSPDEGDGGYGDDGSEGSETDVPDDEGDAGRYGSDEAPADPNEGSRLLDVAETDLGDVLTDADGHTLYGLTDDTAGTDGGPGVPTCDGECAETWPPLLVDSGELPGGLSPDLFSVVQRSDGTWQLRRGNWPLYRFAGDDQRGDTNGQGVQGVWFVVSPSGELLGDGEGPFG
jgi:predicted lipoprotein with Yx(FWY)xxD motif